MQRVCIVTGASRGIGRAIAERLARGGCAIVAVARANLAPLEEALAGVAPCTPVACDVGAPGAAERVVSAALRSFGRVDILVNNAGFAPLSPIEQMRDEDFARCVDVNIAAVFRMTRAAWGALRASRGVIVNISSVASADPFTGFAVYGGCKAWVNTFSKACADEGRAAGIRCYAVAPGAVETGMLREHFPQFPAEQALAPDEVAQVVERCCGDAPGVAGGETVFVTKGAEAAK